MRFSFRARNSHFYRSQTAARANFLGLMKVSLVLLHGQIQVTDLQNSYFFTNLPRCSTYTSLWPGQTEVNSGVPSESPNCRLREKREEGKVRTAIVMAGGNHPRGGNDLPVCLRDRADERAQRDNPSFADGRVYRRREDSWQQFQETANLRTNEGQERRITHC